MPGPTRITVILFALLIGLWPAGAGAQDLFWESPETLVPANARFPRAEHGGGTTAVIYQSFTSVGEEEGEITLSLIGRRNGGPWIRNENFLGPVQFAGQEAPVFSLDVDANGVIYCAVNVADRVFSVLASYDGGRSFTQLADLELFSTTVAPRLFVKDDGGLLLFVTRETVVDEIGDSLETYYSVSENGRSWSDLTPLVTDQGKRLNFLPHHTSYRGREYVVFQVLETGERPSYQIYLKTSTDGGRTWGPAVWLTREDEVIEGSTLAPLEFDNQRPYIKPLNGDLGVVWERSVGGGNPQIYLLRLNPGGEPAADYERITTGSRSCRFPQIVLLGGELYVIWFDDRAGDEHIILANRDGIFWDERDLSRISGISTFPRPVKEEGRLFLFWENIRGTNSRLIFLAPDTTVIPPRIFAGNFTPGGRFSQDRYTLSWGLPQDSSGIAGFSYTVDRMPAGEAPSRLMALQNERSTSATVDEDGYWYFHVAAQDYAGNWSETSTVGFYRDTTPPPPVEINDPMTDDEGFLVSNTFTMEWEPPEETENLGGYSYALHYLGGPGVEIDTAAVETPTPPARVMTEDPEAYFRNRDNGTWTFTVRPIDSVGNAGEPATVVLRMNKYIPETYITSVRAQRDELGAVTLEILGRGFSVGGLVTTVLLDRDGRAPYDYEYSRELGLFDVRNDRLIAGPIIEEVEEGTYRVGVIHPLRGIAFSRPVLRMDPTGAVKFGDFRELPTAQLRPVGRTLMVLSANRIVLYMIFALLIGVLIFAVFKIAGIVKEGHMLHEQVEALIGMKEMPLKEKKEMLAKMKKRGMGLRVKFTLFITTLVIIIVMMVALALAYIAVNTQRENLSEGLRNQTEVLLESLTSGARANLPAKNTLELGLIPAQRLAMEDSLFVTITGNTQEDPNTYDYVWASDDPDIREKIDTETLQIGISRIEDRISPRAQELEEQINREAGQELGRITEQLDELSRTARELALSDEPGAAEQLARYQEEISSLERQLTTRLKEIADLVGSVPPFDLERLDEEELSYTFYKPVVYRTIGGTDYYKGMVRLGISTERIITEINDAVRQLIIIILGIAAVAIIIGVVGAVLFASIMIIPIRRLLEGVEKIRDTEDKEKLKDHVINVRTKDEISALAETVNQMTMGLVKAAVANKDLTVGKEVQKMFIPLEVGSDGTKKTTGREETEKVSFFGYYEGAKGVSGDYFDYKKLDDKHYAMIKCDVAGKGVPASLIMVEVATIFLNYFRTWSFEKEGIHLEQLVYGINDLLEERGFKGRFAALIVMILNVENGTLYMCNAGDNLVHIYDGEQQRMIKKVLPESPAAGVFPTMLVEMQNPYQQVPYMLKQGDILMLFTDGVEEAKRHFRNSDFEIVKCGEEGLEEGELHYNHNPDEDSEELTPERIESILDAVNNRGKYRLIKYHNPVPDEELTFDFASCEGSAEDAVLALVAVEKVFRLIPDPSAGPDDKIQVDRRVNEFLQQHFEQYRLYFRQKAEQDEEADYITFTHIKEDEQYDDLTLLSIKRH